MQIRSMKMEDDDENLAEERGEEEQDVEVEVEVDVDPDPDRTEGENLWRFLEHHTDRKEGGADADVELVEEKIWTAFRCVVMDKVTTTTMAIL